jgi:Tol biopolymer transport system component/DNA-binding winged helix-turn-helix (wHTH) protein
MTSARNALFGPYAVDLRSGELRKFGTRVKMGEQPFQILQMLLERPGELVTREELRAKLWAEDTFVDFDHGLNSAVQRLRDCLSDTAEKPIWIETIPRRGYRFVGQMERSGGAGLSPFNGEAAALRDEMVPDGEGKVTAGERIPVQRSRAGILHFQQPSDMHAELQSVKCDTDSSRAPAYSTPGVQSCVAPTTSDVDVPRSAKMGIISSIHPESSWVITQAAKQHKLSLTAGILVLLALIAAATSGVYSLLLKRPAPFEHFTITKLTNTGDAVDAAISPDGKYALIITKEKGKQSLRLHHVPTGSDTQVIPPADVSYASPAFSPDGNFIYFRKAADKAQRLFNLFRAPVLGGTPRELVHDLDTHITFSPGGKRIAFVRSNDPVVGEFQLLTADADGTSEKIVLTGPIAGVIRGVAWSPDGKQLASIPNGLEDAMSAIQLVDVRSSKVRMVARFDNLTVGDLVWMPNGRGLLTTYLGKTSPFARDQIGLVSIPSGQFRAVTNDTSDYQALSLSADGKTVATVQLNSIQTLYLLPATGFTGNPLGPAPAQSKVSFNFSWASNGDLYFNDGHNVLRTSTDGSNKITILSDSATQIFRPFGCRSGHYILLVWGGRGDGKYNVWRVNADGSHPKQLSDGISDLHPACSPDGRWAYYQDYLGSQIKRVPIDGGAAQIVPGTVLPSSFLNALGFDVSRDGKLLVFTTTKTDERPLERKIVLVNLDASEDPPRRMLDFDPRHSQSAVFSPDGKAVVYPILESGTENLWLQPLDGSHGHLVTNFPSDSIQSFSFSPDGKTLGVLRVHTESDVVLLTDSASAPQ